MLSAFALAMKEIAALSERTVLRQDQEHPRRGFAGQGDGHGRHHRREPIAEDRDVCRAGEGGGSYRAPGLSNMAFLLTLVPSDFGSTGMG